MHVPRIGVPPQDRGEGHRLFVGDLAMYVAPADALTYVQAALKRGLDADHFAPRFAFNFTAGTDLFHEAAKFRASCASP